MLDDDRPAWERQQGEGPRQFRYFERFLALGEGRTRYRLVDEMYGRRRRTSRNRLKRQVSRWALRWQWDERAQAWDRMVWRRGEPERRQRLVEVAHAQWEAEATERAAWRARSSVERRERLASSADRRALVLSLDLAEVVEQAHALAAGIADARGHPLLDE